MPTTVHDSNRIYYDVRGAGPAAILFNHSGASSLAWSERFLEALALELTVITFDYRGTGHSSPAIAAFSLADLAADAHAVLDVEQVDKAIVIGTSMGGAVAQEFALAFPERLFALVLIGTFAGNEHFVLPDPRVLELLKPPPRPENRVGRMQRLLLATYSPAYLEQNEDLALELELKGDRFTTGDTIARHAAAVREFEAGERLPSITAPTLVIHGTDDPIIPVANGELLAARIQGAEYIALDGIGHLPAVEKPVETAHEILQFLAARKVIA